MLHSVLLWSFFFFLFGLPGLAARTPVGGVELSWGRWPRRRWFFFSFRALSEVSAFSKRWGGVASWVRGLGFSTLRSFTGLPWLLAAIELAGRVPRGQCWSVLQVAKQGRSAALASTSTAFCISSLKLSNSRPHCSISALTEGFGPSRKYLIIVGSLGAPSASNSNKMDCRCSRWEAQSSTDSD